MDNISCNTCTLRFFSPVISEPKCFQEVFHKTLRYASNNFIAATKVVSKQGQYFWNSWANFWIMIQQRICDFDWSLHLMHTCTYFTTILQLRISSISFHSIKVSERCQWHKYWQRLIRKQFQLRWILICEPKVKWGKWRT